MLLKHSTCLEDVKVVYVVVALVPHNEMHAVPVKLTLIITKKKSERER